MIDAATATLANTYKYDAYGNQESISSTDTNPFRYSGEYYDSETGFIYLRARYYDSTIGSFISEDPARDGANWYAYCAGNPVMFVDPSGEVAEWIVVALYAYVQAVLASPDLQFDMQMLVHDIGEGDYVSAAFGLVDILTPGFSGSKSVPKIIRKYFDDVVGFVGSTGNRAVSNIPLQRISHIVNGSKYNDHLWRNVTDNVNWNNIKKIISDTIDNGVVVSEKTYINNNILTKVYTVIKEYKGNTVEVKYRIINGVVEVTDAWVRK